MPLYDYQCEACETTYEARHGFDAPAPPCPACGSDQVHRVITRAPSALRGIMALAGSGGNASKEELQSKWAEETPKLRKKLADKLGEDTVNRYAPSLNHNYD
ncbi:MAG: zinc ribbon domain-containing protein [Anaerolineae bacterium]|nr:zinc ribbon domain-containing protein [Anaerolineae bacterium]